MKYSMQQTVIVFAVNILMSPVFAEEQRGESPPVHNAALTDAEIDARLDYLMERLDDRSTYATYWWRGWTGFYALGVVVQSTRAGLADGGAKQADYIVSAVKATSGTLNLLRHPFAWTHGADDIRTMPSASREDRLAQMNVAEKRLRRFAEMNDRRLNWFSHAMNVAINAAGAGIVHGGWGDAKRAWTSAGIGIAVGEVMLFSHPWWHRQSYDEYQQRFSVGAGERKVSWAIVPTLNGVAVHATF